MLISNPSTAARAYTKISPGAEAPEETDVWSGYQDVFELQSSSESTRTAQQFAEAEQRLRQRQLEFDRQRNEAQKQQPAE